MQHTYFSYPSCSWNGIFNLVRCMKVTRRTKDLYNWFFVIAAAIFARAPPPTCGITTWCFSNKRRDLQFILGHLPMADGLFMRSHYLMSEIHALGGVDILCKGAIAFGKFFISFYLNSFSIIFGSKLNWSQ